MGVGAGLYMCDVVKKVHVRYLISWWVLVCSCSLTPNFLRRREGGRVLCANCDKMYVGETGRKLGARLHEHKTKVESKTKRAFTRSQCTASLTEYSKSALTDHANQTNHTIDWKKTTVIDRKQDRPIRWIKEAVHICKEGHRSMNWDEGSCQLSHAYDRFLYATADRHIKTQKNWVPSSSDEDLVMRLKCRNKV